jgi:SAM-dependent methyltransferase
MRLADLMNYTWAYRAWQAPFADAKLRPFFAHNDLSSVRRVLDVGCGPGTNARHFADVDYTGVDINDGYIADARRRYGRDFRVADVTRLAPGSIEPADVVFVNSLLHHLDDAEVHRTLAALPGMATPDGTVHILDLVLPDALGAPRVMARLDRGRYARRADRWRALFAAHFVEQVFEPYTFAGLWAMVYFRGSIPGTAARARGGAAP